MYAIAILAAGIFAYGYWASPHSMTQPYAIRQVLIGSSAVTAEVADTEALRERGLSGRQSLPEGRGMLFVFDSPGLYGFWMKDMRFSIDIIWAAADGTIISIERDASPESYPRAFHPAAPAQYVLEVPAGFSRARGIEPGMALRW